MWIRVTESHNQGLNTYIKGELRDVSDTILDSLPPDVYEPAASPYEAQVDQAARVRDEKKQTFLRLQQGSILAADKLRTAVGIAADRRQSLTVTQGQLEELRTARTYCQRQIEKLENNTTKKGRATLAKQVSQLETIDKQVTILELIVAKLAGQLQTTEAEADLQSLTAEDARLAADQANPDKQEQSSDEQQQPEQNEPAGDGDSAVQPKDADNPEGQTVSA